MKSAPGTAGAFPIIGIGASAGGLEALESFFRHVPDDSGLAFVIVQHLDPTHKGIMPELLQRFTSMKVVQVRDRMKVKPGGVFVIPPNRDMTILRGTLHLFPPTAPRGLRLPIDFFFRSLADDLRGASVGVILSGMGSDGTLGVRAIREKAGLVLVQEPASAKFDSMPRSVIDAGLADVVAPAEELPGKLIAALGHTLLLAPSAPALATRDQSALEKVLILLRMRTGQDFFPYKKQTVYRRIERRMAIHKIDRIASYARYLQENPQEVDLLSKELLIGVTGFFRDPAAWDLLRKEAIPSLISALPSGGTLRAWSAGCSTGEEAYSLAIVFKEALDQLKPRARYTLQIFATDLDRDAIDKARQGVWPAAVASDVPPERLRRFFSRVESGLRAGKEIREMVTFATQNVIMDPPFTKMDILLCRNLLIYLTPEMQRKLISLFHYSLNPGGFLFLGNSETIGTDTELFAPLDGRSRIYRRRDAGLRTGPTALPVLYRRLVPGAAPEVRTPEPSASLQSLAEQVLLRQYAPPAVLVGGKGDILSVSGRTGAYLEPAAGKANWNVFAMVREGLRFELTSAFQRATRAGKPVTVSGGSVAAGDRTQAVDVTVQVLENPEALRGLALVVFTDVPTPPEKHVQKPARAGAALGTGTAKVEQELQRCRDELQSTREEMQTSQEELTSANEELQSTNEELQSTNEELTTSREEMQSLNEELHTVNAEQQTRLDELQRLSNDMRNLLDSTEIVTVFLDGELRVRRFTSGAGKIFKLLPGDVGRPLTDITSSLDYPEMPEDGREVLRTLAFSEKTVATNDGRWFTVRIMPYRTVENVIDGLVITFGDITLAKTLEAKLRAAAKPSRGEKGKGMSGRKDASRPGRQQEALRLNHELQIHQIELEMQNEELRRAQEQLEASRARYFDLYDMAPVSYFTVSEKGVILEANITAATLLGIERAALLAQPLARFVVREDQRICQRQFGEVFASGELLVWEMRLLRAGEPPFWAHVEAIVRPDIVTGQSVCRLVASDISEHRTIEAALQESEERYRVIVESSRDLIFFLDQGGRLRWANKAFREIVGAVPADDELFRRVHPADAPHLAAAWQSARQGEVDPAKVSYRLRTVDGGHRHLESTIRKVSLAGEELWCVLSTDTTELTRLRRKVGSQDGIAGMVGRDPKMLEINASIRELAEEDVPVLILGESGTGKELIASAIHREGPRAGKNFVAINCGAIPDTLLETELFGHVKGSFTGAHRDKKGRFELADGGSIFLDEVGDLSLAMQVKLLRVLQEGTFEKVGAETTCRVDVRVISATNKDLRREVAANRFREDLFYRLSVVPLTVPPLRERLSDIPLLVQHILDEEARRSDRRHDPARPPRKVTVPRETLVLLIAHHWPGNIRELQNVLRFALIKCKGQVLRPEHLPPSFAAPGGERCGSKGRKPKISGDAAAKALELAGGRPGEAARSLGVSRATLYRHLPKERK